ncbi:hypothetical protein PLESTM_000043400 [Pleodorina starrii]|nr:hypothetical protein PLESTM_000043400 [Pleodorina starrii]
MKALHRSLRQIRVAYEAEYHRSMRLEAQVEYLKKLLDGILVERRLEREEMERGQQYLSDISGAYGEVCLMVMDMMVAALGDKVDEQITTAFAALEAATPGVPVTAPDACASSRLGLLRAWSLSGCGTTRSARSEGSTSTLAYRAPPGPADGGSLLLGVCLVPCLRCSTAATTAVTASLAAATAATASPTVGLTKIYDGSITTLDYGCGPD